MKIFLSIIAVLMFASCVSADMYVVYEKDTKNVLSISERDDAVLPDDSYEKSVIKGNPDQFNLMYESEYYQLKNGKLILNSKKLNDMQEEGAEFTKKVEEDKLVTKRAKKDACEALKSEGVTLKYIKCSDYE